MHSFPIVSMSFWKQIKFSLLIACFLLPSSTTSAKLRETKSIHCRGPPFRMHLPPRPSPFVRPHSAQVDQQPFVPYKILYLIDGGIELEDIAKVKMATEYVNERFSKLIKARKLADVRYQNLDPDCEEQCRGMPFPADFFVSCSAALKPEPPDAIKRLNEVNYTLVVGVFVKKQGVVANETLHCRDDSGAYAQSCALTGDEMDHGPHHGFFVFCLKPSTMSDSALRNVVMHETLHILMPYSLSGVGANPDCFDFDDCKNKTWKEAKRQALNEYAQAVDVTIGIAIAPSILTAAKDHFGCDTAEGAEMNFLITDKPTMDIDINHGHWSQYLFPDELMAPYPGTTARLSNLTLSALASHINWYQVDQAQAEPLVYSKPSEELSCDVAHKSCFDILREQTVGEVKFIRPYCDHRQGANRSITSHCSSDHQRQLTCVNHVGDSGCPFLTGTDDYIYDSDMCSIATTLLPRTLAANVGASFGPGTICVTTTNFPPWEAHRTNAVCVHHECREDSLILKFKPNNNSDPNCDMTCPKSQSNQLLTVSWCGVSTHRVTIICPDYEQVCKKETITPAITSAPASTTTSSQTATISVSRTTAAVLSTSTSVHTTTTPMTTSNVPTMTGTVRAETTHTLSTAGTREISNSTASLSGTTASAQHSSSGACVSVSYRPAQLLILLAFILLVQLFLH